MRSSVMHLFCVFSHERRETRRQNEQRGKEGVIDGSGLKKDRYSTWEAHVLRKKKKKKGKPLSWTQQSLKNSMMTLEEKEKPIIQQGAYMVIKSHVKKKKKGKKRCKHKPPTLTGSVATLPVRAVAFKIKKLASVQHIPALSHLWGNQYFIYYNRGFKFCLCSCVALWKL